VLKAAAALELHDVIHWIARILLEVQRQADKPDKRVLVVITQAFQDIEDYVEAIAACEMAQKLDPEDGKIHQMLGNLSAKYAIKKGRYDEKGDFTKGVRDMDKQKELMDGDSLTKDKAYLEKELEKARADHLRSPTVVGKINALADALLKLDDEKHENEATELLTGAHQQLGAYQFKMRVGNIRIQQMTRRYRQYVKAGKKDEAIKQMERQLAFELEEFAERAANYPTDLGIRFELGRRQFIAGRYDDAIASLQEAQREPRRRLAAMDYLGQAFAKKGWAREAVDTFDKALQSEVPEQRAKDLRYNLGCALEQKGELKRAQDEFSTVAQQDYNYKDVRQKLEDLREKLQQQGESKD
jgi:tetratricopeptide (TPR) repeat protein